MHQPLIPADLTSAITTSGNSVLSLLVGIFTLSNPGLTWSEGELRAQHHLCQDPSTANTTLPSADLGRDRRAHGDVYRCVHQGWATRGWMGEKVGKDIGWEYCKRSAVGVYLCPVLVIVPFPGLLQLRVSTSGYATCLVCSRSYLSFQHRLCLRTYIRNRNLTLR